MMSGDQFRNQWNQFKGELKKQWGKFIEDHLVQTEGDDDKFIGSLQERYGDQKEAVRQEVDQWYEQHQAAKPGLTSRAR